MLSIALVGFRETYETNGFIIVSVLLSVTSMSYAFANTWTAKEVDDNFRVRNCMLGSKKVTMGCLAFCLSDFTMRALAFVVAAS